LAAFFLLSLMSNALDHLYAYVDCCKILILLAHSGTKHGKLLTYKTKLWILCGTRTQQCGRHEKMRKQKYLRNLVLGNMTCIKSGVRAVLGVEEGWEYN